MAATDRNLDVVAFVADHFRDILRRRLRELCGLTLLICALLGAIALATWSVQDPSLSHATQTKINNLLGLPGAIFSDLAMQLLGLASVMLLLPETLLGWRLLTHKPLGESWRTLIWIAAAFFAAGFASTLPRIGTWPLPTGLGGACGDAMLILPALILGRAFGGLPLMAVAVVFALAAVAAVAVAAGIGWKRRADEAAIDKSYDDDAEAEDDEHEEADRGSPMLGMIVHALLSWKARIGLWLRGQVKRSLEPKPVAAKGPRQEPRFDGLGRVAAPSMAPSHAEEEEEYEEDEGEEEEEEAPRARRTTSAAPAKRKNGRFQLPSLNFLSAQKPGEKAAMPKDVIDAAAQSLESVLGDFGVRGEIVNARPGPVVTLYELEPAPGIKSSRVIGLADDIARSMSAVSARVAVVAGRNAIGIELPNPVREKVYFRELLATKDYNENAAKLPLCLGKTIGGESVIVDLARMPHLLIAGTTGSGK